MRTTFLNSGHIRAFGFSKIGRAHFSKGVENQDRYQFGGDGRWFYCALADGVSSASKASLGAEYAVEAVREMALSLWSVGEATISLDALCNQLVRRWRMLVDNSEYSEFATTINFVIGLESIIIAGRIGDGGVFLQSPAGIILWKADEFCQPVTPALSNVVRRKDFEIAVMPRLHPINFLLMSDGISKEVEDGEELKLLEYLTTSLSNKDNSIIANEVIGWMSFLEQRNDDDKSFCFARVGGNIC